MLYIKVFKGEFKIDCRKGKISTKQEMLKKNFNQTCAVIAIFNGVEVNYKFTVE